MSVSCLLVRLIDLKINCLEENKLVRLLSYRHESVTAVTKKSQLGWNSNRKQSSHHIFFLLIVCNFLPPLYSHAFSSKIHLICLINLCGSWTEMRLILLTVSLTHRLYELFQHHYFSTSQMSSFTFLNADVTGKIIVHI